MPFETLTKLPERVREDDGIFYPEEYRGKVYLFNNELVFIGKSQIFTFPYPLYEAILQACIENINENLYRQLEEGLYNSLGKQLFDSLLPEIENEYEKFREEILQSINSRLEEAKNEIAGMIIEEMEKRLDDLIDSKIKEVENKLKEVIDEKIIALESLKREDKSAEVEKRKLSLKEVFALSEVFSAEDLVKLRDAGLI